MNSTARPASLIFLSILALNGPVSAAERPASLNRAFFSADGGTIVVQDMFADQQWILDGQGKVTTAPAQFKKPLKPLGGHSCQEGRAVGDLLALSTDAKQLLVTTSFDGDTCLINLDGTPVARFPPLAKQGGMGDRYDPRLAFFSPSSKEVFIAAQSSTPGPNPTMWFGIYDSGGRVTRSLPVLGRDFLNVLPPPVEWNEKAQRIVFATMYERTAEVLRLDYGGEPKTTQVLRNTRGGDIPFAVNPNGNSLVHWEESQLVHLQIANGKELWRSTKLNSLHGQTKLAFSGDGKKTFICSGSKVVAVDHKGKVRAEFTWEMNSGIAACETDHQGKRVMLVSGGTVALFSDGGKKLWETALTLASPSN